MEKKNEWEVCGKGINLEEFDESGEMGEVMGRKEICFECGFWCNGLGYDKEVEKEGKIGVISGDYCEWVSKIGGNILMVGWGFGGI